MAGISISDETHDGIENIAYEQHTSKKEVADKLWAFASRRKERFIQEMF